MAVTDTWDDWTCTSASNLPAGTAVPEIDDELRNIKSQVKSNVIAGESIGKYSSLAAAITAISTTSQVLIIDQATTVSTNATIPSTLAIIVNKPGMFNISSGVTLTINGPLEAGLHQIFSCTGTGAVSLGASSVQEVYPEWWATNTTPGTTDMTAAVQAALNAHHTVKFQSCKYNLTAVITLGYNRLKGVPVTPMIWGGSPLTSPGTWLHFNHTGKGITSDEYYGGVIEDLGTYRTQPAAGAAWAPTAHDYDLYIDSDIGFRVENVHLLNPTKAIFITGGGGQVNLYNITGQPFQKGVVVDYAADVCRLENIHWYPYWSTDSNVTDYTTANLDAFQLVRADAPFMSNCFSIYSKSFLRFSQGANATMICNLLNATNLYADFTTYPIWADNTLTGTPTGQIVNFTCGGDVVGSKGIFCEGPIILDINNWWIIQPGLQAIDIDVAGVTLRLVSPKIQSYDYDASNCVAIDVAAGSKVFVDGNYYFGASGGSGGRYSATGDIRIDDWRQWTPSAFAVVGTITSFTLQSGQYKVHNGTVEGSAWIYIADNGTGSGYLGFTLPGGTTAVGAGNGYGREPGVTNDSLYVGIANGETNAYVSLYNGDYPGANGAILLVDFKYRIAESIIEPVEINQTDAISITETIAVSVI